jgi:hypothetical protein
MHLPFQAEKRAKEPDELGQLMKKSFKKKPSAASTETADQKPEESQPKTSSGTSQCPEVRVSPSLPGSFCSSPAVRVYSLSFWI